MGAACSANHITQVSIVSGNERDLFLSFLWGIGIRFVGFVGFVGSVGGVGFVGFVTGVGSLTTGLSWP